MCNSVRTTSIDEQAGLERHSIENVLSIYQLMSQSTHSYHHTHVIQQVLT